MSAYRAELAISILALPLFLWGVGDALLWTDEAQTALLGQSVLEHGVPLTGHGPGSASALCGGDAGVRGLHLSQAWGQAYLAALGIFAWGPTAFGARVLFALTGWLCVPLSTWVAAAGGGDRRDRVVAATLTATSVFFLLHARQVRYYAPAAALVLLAVGAYLRFAKARRGRDAFALSLSLAGLVLFFDPAAIALMSAMLVHAALTRRGRLPLLTAFRGLFRPFAGPALLLLGWTALTATAVFRQRLTIDLKTFLAPVYYGVQLNAHVLPLLLVAPLAWIAYQRRNDPEVARRGQALALVATISVAMIALLMIPNLRFPRYIVPIVPLLFTGFAMLITAVWPRTTGGTATLVALLAVIVTGVPHKISNDVVRVVATTAHLDRFSKLHPAEPWRPYLVDYVLELSTPVNGPLAAVVAHLGEHARPGDSVVTTYGVASLQWHTGLDTYGGLTCELPDSPAQWLWVRSAWSQGYAAGALTWIDEARSTATYDRIELAVSDRPWENREDIHEHVFAGPGPPAPPVVLYRLADR